MNPSRRSLLGGAAALALTAAVRPLVARAADGPRGPAARIEPVTDSYFGQAVTDSYRWMENAHDPDWAPFLSANRRHARSVLDALPDRPALERRLRELAEGFTIVSMPWLAGGREFFEVQSPDAQLPILHVRENGRARPLIDVSTLAPAGQAAVLTWWRVSPQGRHVALGIALGGREEPTLMILDVDAGALLPERIERCETNPPSWLPDGSGLFYTWTGDGAFGSLDYRTNMQARLHRLGADPAGDRVILAPGLVDAVRIDPGDSIEVYTTRGSGWLLAETSQGAYKGLWKARLSDILAGGNHWEAIFSPDEGAPRNAVSGDRLWMWGAVEAFDGAPGVLRLELNGSAAAEQSLMARFTRGRIEHAAQVEGGLFVALSVFSYSQLFFVSDAGEIREIALPFRGFISTFGDSREPGSIDVGLGGWLEPSAVWRLDTAGGMQRIDLPYQDAVDTSAYEVVIEEATARDGEIVPVTVIARRGLPRDGSAPCLVRAYGAYGRTQTAGFDRLALALLERGGALAFAHVRGGGEFGEAWRLAGKEATKPNTWRDLIDGCEHLITQGWTRPEHLGISGGSAGGIAVGRAMTERPDLFGLVVSSVGVLNPLRSEVEANGRNNIHEFGSVETEAGFEAILAIDTLHHIEDGVRYPAVLLTHGANDARVAAWHSAKTAARLRAAAPVDGRPILFRVDEDAGHLVNAVEPAIADQADIFAALLNLAGPG